MCGLFALFQTRNQNIKQIRIQFHRKISTSEIAQMRDFTLPGEKFLAPKHRPFRRAATTEPSNRANKYG